MRNEIHSLRSAILPVVFFAAFAAGQTPHTTPARMEWIQVAPDGKGFVLTSSGHPFTPWGFNYDHDAQMRFLEDYWDTRWSDVEADFREMKELGANVVRIHLQLGRFMRKPDEPNSDALDRLARVVALAERVGLYLDITGLACYRKPGIPAWYDGLSESARWDVQARFWEAVSSRCAASPAVFCYDLMNEPVVPGDRRAPGDWLGPPFLGEYYYVQFISLDPAGRTRPEVARQWIRRLTPAIRKHDRRHLITVGLVDWSLDRPGLTSGFVPDAVAPELDFLCVHIYPETGKLDEALTVLKGFCVGKPVVIEEMFPLQCSPADLGRFARDSRQHASGWITFYWGKTPREYRASTQPFDAMIGDWLDVFGGLKDKNAGR